MHSALVAETAEKKKKKVLLERRCEIKDSIVKDSIAVVNVEGKAEIS